MNKPQEIKIEYSHIISKKLLEINDGQLTGLARNPRFIKDEKFAKLKHSLEQSPEFLKARPLLVYPMSNGHYIIIAGNMRFLAGCEIGITEFPCYIFPKETTVDKLREYVIKDNLAYGSTDWELIANEWNTDDLEDWGMDIPDFLGDAEEEEPQEQKKVDEDDYDPDEDDSVDIFVKEGEIWLCGDHKLLCGDSTKAENVKRLMGAETAQMWLTDPPYNVGYGIDNHQRKNGDAVLNDKQDEESFRKFLDDAYLAVKNVLDAGATYYIFHSDSHGLTFRQALEDVGDLTLRQVLIWNKNSAPLSRQDYNWKHEPILEGWKDGASHHWYGDHKQTTVIDFDRPTKSELHPTMKSVPLFGYLMQNSSKEGDIIIDTFGSSGTTMIAAEQLGRKARLMELSPKYCSVIITRWEKLTGKKAVMLEAKDE